MIDITKALATQLKLYYSDIPVYRENQKQDFKEPCFYINKVSTNPEILFYKQQYRTYHYQIIYFPTPDHVNSNIDYMEDRLLSDFNTTSYGAVSNRSFTKQDDTLMFEFDIKVIAKPVEDTDKQQNMNYRGGV